MTPISFPLHLPSSCTMNMEAPVFWSMTFAWKFQNSIETTQSSECIVHCIFPDTKPPKMEYIFLLFHEKQKAHFKKAVIVILNYWPVKYKVQVHLDFKNSLNSWQIMSPCWKWEKIRNKIERGLCELYASRFLFFPILVFVRERKKERLPLSNLPVWSCFFI